jgi:hypothetical protein
MQLTPQQIDRLYQFTRQHYVEWYDLQTELVDHLANAIEQQWQENPIISFEDALQKEFKKFGVFGFMDVIAEKQVALSKKYKKFVWNELVTFFTWPKIILTVFFTILFYYLFQYLFLKSLLDAFHLLIAFVGIILAFRINLKYQKYKKEKGKVWFLEEMIKNYGIIAFFAYLPFQIGNSLFKFDFNSDWIIGFLAVLSVVFYLYLYIIMFIIPSKAEDYLNETYPEYALENTK